MIPEAAYAMLACARIGAVHSVVFAGFSADALRSRIEDCGARLLVTADEAPRGGRRTPLKANADKAVAHLPEVRQLVVRRTGGAVAFDPAPRHLAARGDGNRLPPLRPGGRGRRGPALHPLHLGLHRPAQGRAAHLGRLPRLRLDDPRVRLRLPRRRHLLVHRGRGLGHRPQLHRLRPARQRRDHAHVRGRAHLARRRALLGGLREAQGQHLLHRPHRHPRADGPGPRMGGPPRPLLACASLARSASRSTPRPGTGTTRSWASTAARSSTPGGRPRPAAS